MAQIWSGSITVLDAKNHTAEIRVYLNAPDIIGEEADDPAEFLQALASMLDDYLDGQIVHLSASRVIPLPDGLKAAPIPIADVEQGARVIWRTDNGVPLRNTFPTWSEDHILVTGDVDITTGVADVLLMFTNPIELPGNWTVQPSSNRGELIATYESFEEKFKESRRR
jgi:hypothetical protein